MSTRAIHLPTPIAVIYSTRFMADLDNGLTPFLREVNQLAAQGVLPATLERTDKGGWRMALHTARYVAWLYPTKSEDAFNLGHAARRGFRDEERLVKGVLLVRAPGGFQPFPDLTTFNQISRRTGVPRTIHRDLLWYEWHNLTAATQATAATSPHGAYLDLLDMVVEASRQIEVARQKSVAPQHYVSRANAKEERYSARGVYRFRLARPSELAQNTVVCLGEARDMRGRVIRVDGPHVTVRFEPGADFNRIGAQGTLEVLPSDRVYRAQRDAIAQLRRGEARNPRLADNLIAARFSAYRPDTAARPVRPLDPDQLEAFQRALTVPDVLGVLGPPGTGKTTTIVEVIQACAARGQRVLITSHTHRAVDNVLEGLPPELNVVRIGNEDNMSSRVKALSSESRVEAARREILSDTTMLEALEEVRRARPVVDRHLAHLHSELASAQSAEAELAGVASALEAAVKRAGGELRAQLDRAQRTLVRQRSSLATTEAALARATKSAARFGALAEAGSPLAFAYRWLAGRRGRRAERLELGIPSAVAAAEQAAAHHARLLREAETAAAGDPLVLRLQAERDKARQTLSAALSELARSGGIIQQMLRPAGAAPASPPATATGWAAFHSACAATLPKLERRAGLLREWHERISDLGVELEREIARYADVVGATCIGTDTSALISDLEFDLTIVDEAGQISTPNLLVPLVRSRRAMLVGDHKQLPPFLDAEIRQWGQSVALPDGEAQEVTKLLARSGFELLFPKAPPANAVWLKTQRRMPSQIAGFVSSTFYFGRLRTQHSGGEPDPVFRSPFAMVNTADRPPSERRETAMRGRGEAIRFGYRNELEARLIAKLVAKSHRHYRDWAVIVPFNAQKELVIERLQGLLGASARVADNVGSVDSFQGGERDLIVFGFTRSNSGGDIGFLKELRRFNVAITRARRQLVLVGDLDTLRRATDEEFRDIMKAMHGHLNDAGDLRSSLEVESALSRAAGEPS